MAAMDISEHGGLSVSDDTQDAHSEPGNPKVNTDAANLYARPHVSSPYPRSNVVVGAADIHSLDVALICDDLARFPHLILECREVIERFKISTGS